MKALDLSLRQKRVLHTMQHCGTCLTSYELAGQLNVSSRTIRNDITKINEELAPYGASIKSLKSKGYCFVADDPRLIEDLNQIETTFFSKENRARYLAFKLCLADKPLDMYELEDEMFISHTTLEHALRDITRRFTDHKPHIQLVRKKDTVAFEDNEVKRRIAMVEMLRESWNYHSRRNAYYNDDFIEPEALDYIIDLVTEELHAYHIDLEDPAIISLNLFIVVMYQRVKSGHPVVASSLIPKSDTKVYYACQRIVGHIESKFQVYIRPEELDQLYLFITGNKIIDSRNLTRSTVSDHFGPITRMMANRYLDRINQYFHLDFSDDDEYYIALLQFIRSLQRHTDIYNDQFAVDLVKIDLRIELILANLFQDLAISQFGHPLTQTQLIYLAYCNCGALEYFIHNHPGDKLRTAICCQMNMPFLFAMKRRLEASFGNYLKITDLMPVHQKNTFDFTNTDLIITTVQKSITDNPNTDTMYMSMNMPPREMQQLERLILQRSIRKIYTTNKSQDFLFENAFRHEASDQTDYLSILDEMAHDFIDACYTDESFLEDILERERISSYVVCPGVVYVYSLVPSSISAMSILTLDHRITWNTHKIRTVIMTCFTPQDMGIIFRLSNLIHDEGYDLDKLKMCKDIDELCEFYLTCLNPKEIEE